MNFQSDATSHKVYHASDLRVGHHYEDCVVAGENKVDGAIDVNIHLDKLSDTFEDTKEFYPAPPPGLDQEESKKRYKAPEIMMPGQKKGELPKRVHSDPSNRLSGHFGNIKRMISTTTTSISHDHREEVASSVSTIKTDSTLNDDFKKRLGLLKRQMNFREVSLQSSSWTSWTCGCFSSVYWSGRKVSKISKNTINVNITGHPWWFRYQPSFWFSMLTLGRWWFMLTVLFAVYYLTILVFGLLFYAKRDSLAQDVYDDEPFLTYLWWSHHTLSTVGYGTLTAATGYGHFVVTLEGILGLVLLALLSGVTWAKFSKINARILWSENAVVTKLDSKPHLMVRCASLWKGHLMLAARMRMSAVVLSGKDEDPAIRYRQVQIDLVKDYNPVFALTGVFMHKIDENSPLLGLLPKWYREKNNLKYKGGEEPPTVRRLLCLIEGFDGLFQQNVVSNHSYIVFDSKNAGVGEDDREENLTGRIIVGHKFADVIMQDKESQKVVVDYSRFHETTVDMKCGFSEYNYQDEMIAEGIRQDKDEGRPEPIALKALNPLVDLKARTNDDRNVEVSDTRAMRIRSVDDTIYEELEKPGQPDGATKAILSNTNS